MKRTFAVCLSLLGIVAHAESTTLLCSATGADGHVLAPVVLKVDYEHNTVNGYQAAFTASEIKWKTPSQGIPLDHILNRLAGTYEAFQVGVMYPLPPPVYRCEKAPAPKF